MVLTMPPSGSCGTKMRGRWLLDISTTLPLLVSRSHGLAILRFNVRADSRTARLGITHRLRHALHPYGIPITTRDCCNCTKSGRSRLHAGASWSRLPCGEHLLPLMPPSFLGGLDFYFLLSAKELSMSVLLVIPQTPVVSVAIVELWENAQVGARRFGVIWTAILVSVPLFIISSRDRYGHTQS